MMNISGKYVMNFVNNINETIDSLPATLEHFQKFNCQHVLVRLCLDGIANANEEQLFM